MASGQGSDAGSLWEDFRVALLSEQASITAIRQIERTFQAVLEGRESFRSIGLFLPELLNCIFGFQNRGRNSWAEHQLGWLQNCERKEAPTEEAEALASLLGPQHALYRTLLAHDDRYIYEFPLQNLPQPLLDEISRVLATDAVLEKNATLPMKASPSDSEKQRACLCSPLAYYLAARLKGAGRDSVRIGAARYYLLCFLAYPVYARQAPALEMRLSAAGTRVQFRVYERVLIAFLSEYLSSQNLLQGRISFDPSTAIQLSTADVFLHALLIFWFHWNGELWPWQEWHDPAAVAWNQSSVASLRDRYRAPTLLTVQCQRLFVLYVLQIFGTQRDQVTAWVELMLRHDTSKLQLARDRPLANPRGFEEGFYSGAYLSNTPSKAAITKTPLRLEAADVQLLARSTTIERAPELWLRHAMTNTPLRFLLVMFCRYFRQSMHRMLLLCVDLDVIANIAFLDLISAWLFPWDHVHELNALRSNHRSHHERRSALLSGLAILQTPFLDENRKPSEYQSKLWQPFLALHFPLYLGLLSEALRFLVRSRCLLQSPQSLELYLDLYRGIQNADWLSDLRQLGREWVFYPFLRSTGIGSGQDQEGSSQQASLCELAGLDRDIFRQNLRELRAQLERRLLSSWNAAILFTNKAARERTERLMEPWIRLFEGVEADQTTDGHASLRQPTHILNVSAHELGTARRGTLLPSLDDDSNSSAARAPSDTAFVEQQRLVVSRHDHGAAAPASMPLGTQIALGRSKCSNLDILPRGDVWQWPKQSNEFGPALMLARTLSLTLEQYTGMPWNLRWIASYVAMAYFGLSVLLVFIWLCW
jgi:hypothetical protein